MRKETARFVIGSRPLRKTLRGYKRLLLISQAVRAGIRLTEITRARAAWARFAGLARCLATPDGKTREQFLHIGAVAVIAGMFSRSPRLFEKLHRMSAFITTVFEYRHLSTSYKKTSYITPGIRTR